MSRDLYFFRNPTTGDVKIGVSVNVQARRVRISRFAGQDLQVLLVLVGGSALEKKLHAALIEERTIGEWFHPSARLVALIEEAQRDASPGRVLERFVGWEDPTRLRTDEERAEYMKRRRRERGNIARRVSRKNKTAARVAELQGDWWRRFTEPTEVVRD